MKLDGEKVTALATVRSLSLLQEKLMPGFFFPFFVSGSMLAA